MMPMGWRPSKIEMKPDAKGHRVERVRIIFVRLKIEHEKYYMSNHGGLQGKWE
jgi:hypothetical protein